MAVESHHNIILSNIVWKIVKTVNQIQNTALSKLACNGTLCWHSYLETSAYIYNLQNGDIFCILFYYIPQVWSGTLGKQVCSHSLPDNSPSTVCVFSPDGGLLLTGYHSGNLCLLDVLTGHVIVEVRHHESRVSGVAWCSSNQELPGVIVGYHSGVVEVRYSILIVQKLIQWAVSLFMCASWNLKCLGLSQKISIPV